jgi:hypothetical protein
LDCRARQRDKETEKQKDRATERLRDKKSETQRFKDKKRQRDRGTQKERRNLLDDAKIVQIWIVEGDIHRHKSGSSSNPKSFLEFIDNGSRWSSQ